MPAHERDNGRSLGEPARQVGRHGARALDPADRRGLWPLALAHVRLGMVDAERPDPDEDLVLGGYRVG